jgi:hypothetical protein
VAYISATILVVGWCDRLKRFWPIRLSLALNVALFAAFTLVFAGAWTVRLPKSLDVFHQMRGWRSLSELVWRRMATMPEASLAADDREVMAELDYTLRSRPFPLVMATGKGPPGNSFALEYPLTAENGAHVLLVSRWRDRNDIFDRFADHKLIETWGVSAGAGRVREYYVFELSGFKND